MTKQNAFCWTQQLTQYITTKENLLVQAYVIINPHIEEQEVWNWEHLGFLA